ncbi:putative elongation of fatty acids protein DDB_G0272012 [Pistacia vera]|uniref:putative elongation of fatty acids protein DDB_G0272012 n=1 Tax=Pistacia vera TaxID=55513 RepID=UPI0012634904|nr:putative elongation of fatty acids protein DDB_G0272012 [Pistacia vera]
MNQTASTPMFSILLDWFVNDPKILHFSWIEGQTPASSPQFLTLTVVSYLSITLFLSQNHPISIARPLLRRITVVHNLILINLSLIMAIGCLLSIFFHAPNIHYVLCYPKNVEPKGPLFFWAYVFYLSKIYEYVDTFLIVVSKSMKRLSFLHVYHHATVLIMCYIGLHTSQSSFPVVLVTNCVVHVFMYYYYLLCAIGKRPKWKRLVTDIQILQFMSSFINMLIVFFFHFTGSGCSGIWGYCFSMAFISTLLVLFIDFHSKNYNAKKDV